MLNELCVNNGKVNCAILNKLQHILYHFSTIIPFGGAFYGSSDISGSLSIVEGLTVT